MSEKAEDQAQKRRDKWLVNDSRSRTWREHLDESPRDYAMRAMEAEGTHQIKNARAAFSYFLKGVAQAAEKKGDLTVQHFALSLAQDVMSGEFQEMLELDQEKASGD